MRNTFKRVFRSLLFVVLFKYAYHVFIFTLGQFSFYQFDRQLVFYFPFSYRLPGGVHYRRLVLYRLPLFSFDNFTNFHPQPRKSNFGKARNDICFACGKTGHWRAKCPSTNSYFTARSTLSSSQTKPPALLGSGNSISEHDVVNETTKGISVFGHVLVGCFEYERAPSGIPIVKGRLRAHYNFWSKTLEANNFMLRVIEKGYAIPFISVPPKAFLYNNASALTHAVFVAEAVQELLISGSIIEVPSLTHVVNPLSVCTQSTWKRG